MYGGSTGMGGVVLDQCHPAQWNAALASALCSDALRNSLQMQMGENVLGWVGLTDW